MVGLSAEQYAGYLIDRKGAPDIVKLIRVRHVCARGIPLCFAMPSAMRSQHLLFGGWTRRVESYLERLYWAVKAEDPNGLVTYVNYPTTEYLHLPFLDLVTFNVYLESQDQFDAYLARLHNIAGDRPLLMSEIGLDSLRNGEATQAQALEWQLRSTFAPGCAGAFIFSWTDEWHRAGAEVEDWALASPPEIVVPNQLSELFERCSPTSLSPRNSAGRRYPLSYAPLMAAEHFLNAWRVYYDLSILTTR